MLKWCCFASAGGGPEDLLLDPARHMVQPWQRGRDATRRAQQLDYSGHPAHSQRPTPPGLEPQAQCSATGSRTMLLLARAGSTANKLHAELLPRSVSAAENGCEECPARPRRMKVVLSRHLTQSLKQVCGRLGILCGASLSVTAGHHRFAPRFLSYSQAAQERERNPPRRAHPAHGSPCKAAWGHTGSKIVIDTTMADASDVIQASDRAAEDGDTSAATTPGGRLLKGAQLQRRILELHVRPCMPLRARALVMMSGWASMCLNPG